MPYSSISQLPPNVKNVLPAHAQRIYLRAFNSAMKQHDDEDKARKIAWTATKKTYRKDPKGRWVKRMSEETNFLVPFEFADKSLLFPYGKCIWFPSGKFTKADGEEMVQNFKNNVLDRKNGYLPINAEHERAKGKVGYITDLVLGENGVTGTYEWDNEDIKGKFDYLSPEVKWADWKHPYTGKKYGNLLFGVALTNYPKLLGKTAIFSEGDWLRPETEEDELADLEENAGIPITDGTWRLRSVNDAMELLRSLENYDGLEIDARSALEALKKIAHKIVDEFKDADVDKSGDHKKAKKKVKEDKDMSEFNEEAVQSLGERLLEFLGKNKPEPESVIPDKSSEQLSELEAKMSEFETRLAEKEVELLAEKEAKEAAEKEAREFSDKLIEEEKQRKLAEFTAVAKGLNAPIKPEEFGSVLMAFHDSDASEDKVQYKLLISALEAMGSQEKMAALFSETGTDAVGADPMSRFDRAVENRMKEAKVSLSEATEWVAEHEPGLYNDYNKATLKSGAGSPEAAPGVEEV